MIHLVLCGSIACQSLACIQPSFLSRLPARWVDVIFVAVDEGNHSCWEHDTTQRHLHNLPKCHTLLIVDNQLRTYPDRSHDVYGIRLSDQRGIYFEVTLQICKWNRWDGRHGNKPSMRSDRDPDNVSLTLTKVIQEFLGHACNLQSIICLHMAWHGWILCMCLYRILISHKVIEKYIVPGIRLGLWGMLAIKDKYCVWVVWMNWFARGWNKYVHRYQQPFFGLRSNCTGRVVLAECW